MVDKQPDPESTPSTGDDGDFSGDYSKQVDPKGGLDAPSTGKNGHKEKRR